MYITDAVEAIQTLSLRKKTGVMSVGTGVETSFNEVVATINEVLETTIEPFYLPKPVQYVESITATPVPYQVSLLEGINRILHA